MSNPAVKLKRPATRVRVPMLLEAHALTTAVAALSAGLLLVLTAAVGMVGDSWLALVAGREIAEHGLPARDHLTAVTFGRRWIDQQWLGQLALYGLHRLARDYFPILLTCLSAIPAMVGALVIGRRASIDRVVAAVGLLALLPFAGQAAQSRTQSLAYPAFVVLIWLLLRRQTWPAQAASILVVAVWANLHGSVVLGAAAASLRWLQDARSHRLRVTFLIAATWLATLCSPYALGLPAYYHSTFGNSAFRGVLSQWQPLALTARAVPTWLLIIAVVWVIGRSGQRFWNFKPALLLVLIGMTLQANRTTAFLALAAMALLPHLIEQPKRRPTTSALRVPIAAASLAIGAVMGVAAFTHVRFSTYTPRAAAAAAAAAGAGRVFVPLELGDWLLWAEPSLRGRVAADARAELLTPSELKRFAALWQGVEGWRQATAGYRSFVLSPTDERWLVRRLVSSPGRFRVVYRDAKLVVIAFRQYSPHCREPVTCLQRRPRALEWPSAKSSASGSAPTGTAGAEPSSTPPERRGTSSIRRSPTPKWGTFRCRNVHPSAPSIRAWDERRGHSNPNGDVGVHTDYRACVRWGRED